MCDESTQKRQRDKGPTSPGQRGAKAEGESRAGQKEGQHGPQWQASSRTAVVEPQSQTLQQQNQQNHIGHAAGLKKLVHRLAGAGSMTSPIPHRPGLPASQGYCRKARNAH